MLKFSQLPDKLKYPPVHRAKLSTYHSMMVDEAIRIYTGRYSQRRDIITAINTVSYLVISGDTIPGNQNGASLLGINDTLPNAFDDDTVKATLGPVYVAEKNVEWDIVVMDSDVSSPPALSPSAPATSNLDTASTHPTSAYPASPQAATAGLRMTPKSDLYIQPPIVPRFSSTPVVSRMIGTTAYAIYPSLPDIPLRQVDISATTDVHKLSDDDLLRLYPNHLIRTRPESMYHPVDGLEFDPHLGIILRIDGFTSEQIRENIIKYPHLYRLSKVVDGEIVSFYSTIELDGTLHDITELWSQLSDTSLMPYTADFVKEYVVRRYLLERDSDIYHKYVMWGSLDPFLTLFAPAAQYREWGYFDTVQLARDCVNARVSYKQSRNPILRRMNDNA